MISVQNLFDQLFVGYKIPYITTLRIKFLAVVLPAIIITNLVLGGVLAFQKALDTPQFLSLATTTVITAILYGLSKTKYSGWVVRTTGIILFGCYSAIAATFGPGDSIYVLLFVVILIGYLGGRGQAVVAAFVTVLEASVLIYGESVGWFTAHNHNAIFLLTNFTALMATATFMIVVTALTIENLIRKERLQQATISQHQADLIGRDAMLSVLSAAGQKFLHSANWRDDLHDILLATGKAAHSNHVFVCQNSTQPDGTIIGTMIDEWSDEHVAAYIDHPAAKGFDYHKIGFSRWIEILQKHEIIFGAAQDFPETEMKMLERRNIESLIVAPIFVNEAWWGFLAFDKHTSDYEWRKAEIDLVRILAEIIGGAIQRQLSEEMLFESQEQYLALLNTLPDALIHIRRDGTILSAHATDGMHPLTCYNAIDIGADIAACLDDQVVPTYQKLIENAFAANDKVSERVSITCDDHQPYVYNVAAIPLAQAEVLTVARDITIQHNFEQALQESEAKYRAMFESTEDILMVVDATSSKILNVNHTLQTLLHFQPEEYIGKHYTSILHHAEDAPSNLISRINNGENVYTHLVLVGGDGHRHPVDFSVNTTTNDYGIFRVINIRDATRRLAFDKLSTDLAYERELNTLRAQFITTVSHEFRTPLAIIQLSVEMLERHYDKLDDRKRARRYEQIADQINHIENMIERVSTYSRMQEANQRFIPEEIDLDRFMNIIVTTVKDSHASEHVIVVDLDETVDIIQADREMLVQIVQNPLANAVAYSETTSEIYVRIRGNTEEITITIADTGLGIPEEHLPLVFAPFHRANNVENITGTGLGLAIAKQAVHRHGGQIAIDSTLGSGTTVTITLPKLQSARLEQIT